MYKKKIEQYIEAHKHKLFRIGADSIQTDE